MVLRRCSGEGAVMGGGKDQVCQPLSGEELGLAL